MFTPKKVAVIGFGEAGTIIAEGCLKGAASLRLEIACHAWDIRMNDPGQKGKLERTARRMGVVPHGAADSWLGEMDVVFSLVFGGAARQVALDVLPKLHPGAAYIDLTTSVPGDMEATEKEFTAKRIEFIDGTALGSFRTNGVTVPFVLSGSTAEKWSAWMNSLGFNTRPVPGGAGNASNVKLLRSVLAKGLEALGIECFVAADTMGLREAMRNAFNDLDLRPIVETLEDMGGSHITHCKRRLAEIDHALHMLEEAHLEGIMTKASRDFFARTVASGEIVDGEKGANWDAAMGALREILKSA